MGNKLLNDAEKTAVKIAKGRVLFFIEENNPKKMSIRLKVNDEKCGISEKQRVLWWENHGFRKLDFKYVQLPLNAGKNACTYLMLAVKTKKFKIPSEIIKEHLERYFSISVLKGRDAMKNYYFRKEEMALENNKFFKTKLFQ